MRFSKIFLMILVTSFCIVFECYGATEITKKSIAVIEPGIGIGDIKIGDQALDVVKKMNKKPSGGKTVEFDNIIEYWLDYNDMGISFIFDKKQNLSKIAVSNPGIIVKPKEITVNSSATQLERIYGSGEKIDLNEIYEQIRYTGISFTINKKTRKIEVITIEKTDK